MDGAAGALSHRGWLPRRDATLERMPPSSGPWVAADLPDQRIMAISWVSEPRHPTPKSSETTLSATPIGCQDRHTGSLLAAGWLT